MTLSSRSCLLWICQASTHHVVRVLPNRSAHTVANAFGEAWVSPFESPSTIYIDQGKEYDGALADLAEFTGGLRASPVDLRNSLTKVERFMLVALINARSVFGSHDSTDRTSGPTAPLVRGRAGLEERQNTQAETSPQQAKRETRFCQMFEKDKGKQNPDPRDVFVNWKCFGIWNETYKKT